MLVSIPIAYELIGVIWKVMVQTMMSGWLPYQVPDRVFGQMFAIGVLCYLAVAVFEFRRIGKVPMDMALKNVE